MVVRSQPDNFEAYLAWNSEMLITLHSTSSGAEGWVDDIQSFLNALVREEAWPIQSAAHKLILRCDRSRAVFQNETHFEP